jgi:putative N-acetyltransferase (TIGR04045 family)
MSGITCRKIINDEEQAACFRIRKQVFVDEQKLFCDSDLDDHDKDAVHIAAFINDKIIGTVRVYRETEDVWVGGRLAVKKRYRGNAGKCLVLKAVEIVKNSNARVFKAIIQADNVPFFINLKWKPVGEIYLHHGKMHQLMQAQL